MEWQHPEWLYLILPLAAAWLVLSLYSRRRRRRAAGAFVAQAMWSRILPADSRARFWVKLLLRETALVTGLIALAGPRFGTQYEEVIPRGSDLYVLIDVSRSMLAEDVPPSRLGRAKADVAALVNRLDGERVGLIAFAGQAVVKCPLTVDYDAFRRSLDELDPDSAPRGGTAIGDAIRKALEVFQARADRDQAILLITDGDDQQSYPLEAAAVAAERHVTIFTVGLGDADHGARIPQGAAIQVVRRVPGAAGLEQARRLAAQGNRAQDVGRLRPGRNPRLRSGRALREVPSRPARRRRAKPQTDSSGGPVPDLSRAGASGPAGRCVHTPLPARGRALRSRTRASSHARRGRLRASGSAAGPARRERRSFWSRLSPESVGPTIRRTPFARDCAGMARANSTRRATGSRPPASSSTKATPARPRSPRSTRPAPRIARETWRRPGNGI